MTDPMDYYDAYTAWLMANVPGICNGDDLIKHFEAGTRFEEFLEAQNGIKGMTDEELDQWCPSS